MTTASAATGIGIGQGDKRDAHLGRTLIIAIADTIGPRVFG